MKNGAKGEGFFPPNVIAMIFSYLGIYEIGRCACISKSWWCESHPAICDKKGKLKYAWLNGDFEPIVVGEIQSEYFTDLWLEDNLLVVGGQGFLKIWYLDEDKFLDASENVGSKRILSVCFFDGKCFTGDNEGEIIAWYPSTWNCEFKIKAHKTDIDALTSSGKYLASAAFDSKIKLWRKKNRRGGLKCKVLKGHTSYVNDLDFSNDGKLLFSGSDDNTIRVWEATSGACIKVLNEWTDSWGDPEAAKVWGILAAGENQVLSGSNYDDTMLRVWDISSGTVKSSVGLNSVRVFSYEELTGWYIFVHDDNTIKVWESLEDVNCLREFRFDFEVEAICVVVGRFLVILKSGQILVWDFSK